MDGSSDGFTAIRYIGNDRIVAGYRSMVSSIAFKLSTNNGKSWSDCPPVESITGRHIYGIGHNPSTGVVMAGTGDEGTPCIVRSTDKGDRFSVSLSTEQIGKVLGMDGTQGLTSVFKCLHLGKGRWLAAVKIVNGDPATNRMLMLSEDDGVVWKAIEHKGLCGWARSVELMSDGTIVLSCPGNLKGEKMGVYLSSKDDLVNWTRAAEFRAFGAACEIGDGQFLVGDVSLSEGSAIKIYKMNTRTPYNPKSVHVYTVSSPTSHWRFIQRICDGRAIAIASCDEVQRQIRLARVFETKDGGSTWREFGPIITPSGRGTNAIYYGTVTGNGQILWAGQPDELIYEVTLNDGGTIGPQLGEVQLKLRSTHS